MSRSLLVLCLVSAGCGRIGYPLPDQDSGRDARSDAGSGDGGNDDGNDGGPPLDPDSGDGGGDAAPDADEDGSIPPLPNPPFDCVPQPTPGDAIWVATDGDDITGDGSSALPFATFAQAISVVSSGGTIVVKPGIYPEAISLDRFFEPPVTIRSEVPYAAKLWGSPTEPRIIRCYEGAGFTIEGFDIGRVTDPGFPDEEVLIHGADPDRIGAAARLTFRNNVIHEGTTNALLKLNDHAQSNVIERNVFYNGGIDSNLVDLHAVTDVVVQDNVFFNDMANGRGVTPRHMLQLTPIDVPAERIVIRRNVFMHAEGDPLACMIHLGGDGAAFFEVEDVLIENNLFLGDGLATRAPLCLLSTRQVKFRNNTVLGDFTGEAFALIARPLLTGNELLELYNNVWSDTAGTMDSFSNADADQISAFTILHNLYWNGGNAIPTTEFNVIEIDADPEALTADPMLAMPAPATQPRWDDMLGTFADGSTSTCQVHARIVMRTAIPGARSAAFDGARPDLAPIDDILGRARGASPAYGAAEP